MARSTTFKRRSSTKKRRSSKIKNYLKANKRSIGKFAAAGAAGLGSALLARYLYNKQKQNNYNSLLAEATGSKPPTATGLTSYPRRSLDYVKGLYKKLSGGKKRTHRKKKSSSRKKKSGGKKRRTHRKKKSSSRKKKGGRRRSRRKRSSSKKKGGFFGF